MKKNKKQITEALKPHSAIDQQEAAKQNGVPVKIEDLAVIETLLVAANQAKAQAAEAHRRVNYQVAKLAQEHGLDPNEFTLNLDIKAFVPKPKEPPVN